MELSDLCFPSITLAARFCTFCIIFMVLQVVLSAVNLHNLGGRVPVI